MLITNKDKEVSHLKIQKDIINQIIKEIQMKKFTIENDEEAKKYILEVYGKVETFLDIYDEYTMKFINFDNYIEKMIMNILIKTVLHLNILVILLF